MAQRRWLHWPSGQRFGWWRLSFIGPSFGSLNNRFFFIDGHDSGFVQLNSAGDALNLGAPESNLSYREGWLSGNKDKWGVYFVAQNSFFPPSHRTIDFVGESGETPVFYYSSDSLPVSIQTSSLFPLNANQSRNIYLFNWRNFTAQVFGDGTEPSPDSTFYLNSSILKNGIRIEQTPTFSYPDLTVGGEDLSHVFTSNRLKGALFGTVIRDALIPNNEVSVHAYDGLRSIVLEGTSSFSSGAIETGSPIKIWEVNETSKVLLRETTFQDGQIKPGTLSIRPFNWIGNTLYEAEFNVFSDLYTVRAWSKDLMLQNVSIISMRSYEQFPYPPGLESFSPIPVDVVFFPV